MPAADVNSPMVIRSNSFHYRIDIPDRGPQGQFKPLAITERKILKTTAARKPAFHEAVEAFSAVAHLHWRDRTVEALQTEASDTEQAEDNSTQTAPA